MANSKAKVSVKKKSGGSKKRPVKPRLSPIRGGGPFSVPIAVMIKSKKQNKKK